MKIKILMDNIAKESSFSCAHGLSIYIETKNHKIMMDAGPNWQFAENAKRLGIDISDVDTLVLSHGHYDHAGGLGKFMNENSKAKIYAAEGYGLPHYDETGEYIGVEPLLVGNPRITVLKDDLIIDDEVRILGFRNEKYVTDIKTYDMTEGRMDKDAKLKIYPEKFEHEQYLMVTENGKNVLLSGCSHRGILNIAAWAKRYEPAAIVGGFHFMEIKPEDYCLLDSVCEILKGYPIVYYTGHCTGKGQFDHMKEQMKDQLIYASAGSEFEI